MRHPCGAFFCGQKMVFMTPKDLERTNDIRDQSLQDVATLGPTEQAENPNNYMQLASAGITELFKGAAKVYSKGRAKPAVPGDGKPGKPAIDDRPRVPSEAALEPQDLGYVATQDAAAKAVLTPEGVEKFKKQGRTETDLSLEGQKDAQVLEGAQEAVDLTPDEQLQTIVAGAKTGVRLDERGLPIKDESAGLADEAQAIEVLTSAQKGDAFVRSITDGASFNYDRMDAPEDVKQLINAVAENLKDPEQAVKRGIIKNTDTLADAQQQLVDDLGVSKRILKRKIGTTFANAADATAARLVLQDSANKLAELAKKVVNGEGGDETMLAFRRQLAVHNGIQLQIKGAQVEAARLLQSFRIPVSSGMSDVQAAALKLDLVDANGGAHAIRNAATGLLAAARKSRGEFNQTAQVGIMGKVRAGLESLYINGLLSNPRSNLKNILGNAFFMVYQLPEEALAGLYGTGERAIRRSLNKEIDYTNQVYLTDPLARMSGWFFSFRNAWAAASEGFRRGVPGDAVSKVEFNQYITTPGEASTLFGQAMQKLYRFTDGPTRFLLAGDEFFKVMSQNGELMVGANRQMRSAKSNGMADSDAVDEGMMVMLSPNARQSELSYKSKNDTLMSDLGVFGKFMSSIQHTMFGRYIAPFVTAPTNDILQTVKRNPILGSYQTVKEIMSNDPKVRQNAMGRYTLGAFTTGLVVHQAMNGEITGGMPTDKKQREMLPPGWQPYSFVDRGEGFPVDEDGDPLPLYNKFGVPNGPLEYTSYSGLGPASSIIGISANAVQFFSTVRSIEKRNDIAAAAIFATTDYFKELPFLQGVSDIMLAFQRQDATFLFNGPLGAMNLVPGIPNPYSALTRAGERAFDERKTKVNVPFDVYTLKDVEDLTREKVLPEHPFDGGPDYRRVGLAKGDLGDQFFRMVHNGFNQMVATNILSDSDEAEVPQYDTLGRLVTDGPSFAENPMLRLFNAVSPINISSSDAQPEYVNELIRLDWPIARTSEGYEGIDLTVLQQSLLTWLAKGEVDEAGAVKYIPPQAEEAGFLSPVEVRVDGRRNTFLFALQRRMETRAFRKASDRERRSMIRQLNQLFLDAAWDDLTSMPGMERLSTAALDIADLKEDELR